MLSERIQIHTVWFHLHDKLGVGGRPDYTDSMRRLDDSGIGGAINKTVTHLDGGGMLLHNWMHCQNS